MADKVFLQVLTALNKKADLDLGKSNDIITEIIPNLEFLDGKSSSTLFRKLVSFKMKEIKKGNLKQAFKLVNKIYPKLYTNKTTLDNYLSQDVRIPISKLFGVNSAEHKLSKTLVALSYVDKGEILKEQQDKVTKKRLNPEEYGSKQFLDIIQDYKDSDNVFQVLVALSLAIGSRPVEFILRSNYTKENEHWVNQDNIAKQKGVMKEIVKPVVGLMADVFINKVKKARLDLKSLYTKLSDGDTDGLNKSIGSRFNETAKKIYGINGFTAYKAREVYGHLSYEIYQKNKTTVFGKNIKESIWRQRVFGQKEGSQIPNYDTLTLTTDQVTNAEVEVKLENLQVKVDHLEKQVEAKEIPVLKPIGKVKRPLLPTVAKGLKKIYDDHIKTYGKRIPVYKLELQGASIASRGEVRAYYKELLAIETNA